MTCAYITDLATNIWKDIGEPTSITVSYIQSKLVSEYFIGKLNVAIASSYAIVNGDIVPALGTTEQAIYGLLYKSDYYSTRISQTLAGYSVSTMWVEMADGDGRVRRASPTEFAKVLKELKGQIDGDLRAMVGAYRMNNSQSRSVDQYTINPYVAAPDARVDGYRSV